MNTKTFAFFLSLLLFPVWFSSCLDKILAEAFAPKPEVLQTSVESGHLNFSCLVDGLIWNFGMRPFQFTPTYRGLDCSVIEGRMRMYADRRHDSESRPDDAWPRSEFTIEIDSFIGVGTYRLADKSSGNWATFTANDFTRGDKLIEGGTFTTTMSKSNFIEVTEYDTLTRKITGIFSFTMRDFNLKTVKVKYGIFHCENL
ncbi:hypothetical protein GC194_00600 [bacterium]|nr:hypothetical protein [bacterium]